MPHSQPQGLLAVPRTGKGRGILVLHAWWGLTDMIRDFCGRLADEGFTVFAPDLFHGKVAASIKEAETLSNAQSSTQVKADIANAVVFLSERAAQSDQGLAVVGFSFGAYYALDLSVADPRWIRAVVVFYGTGPRDFSRSDAAYLGHFAEADEFEPDPAVNGLEAALRAARRPVTIYRYPGTGHWFFEDDRPEAYNQAAAALAWQRTLAFLRESLPLASS